jgi:hypothetical protein
MASADPEARMAGPVSTRRMRWIRIFGFSAVTIGLALVGLIIYGMLYTYR